MVKKTDGQTFRFRELTTLQKWIVERKVGRDDEISRTAKSWKKLGEIAELTSFFQVVEAAEAAQRSVTASQMPAIQLSATPTGTFQAIPIPHPAPLPTMNEAVPQPSLPPITLAPQAARTQPSRTQPSRTQSGAELSEMPGRWQDDLDDDDPVLAWQKKRRSLVAAAAVLGVGAVIAVVVVVIGSGPSRLDPAVQALAAKALQADDDDRRDDAIEALQPFTAGSEQHPVAQAWRARLLAARAQMLLDESRLQEQLNRLAPASARPPSSTSAAERLLAEATATVVALRTRDVVPPEADLAAADVDLARGDVSALSTDVAMAREHAKNAGDGAERAAIDTEARLLLTLAEAQRVDDESGAKASLQKLERFDDGRARAAAAVAAARWVVVARTAEQAAPADVVEAARQVVARLGDRDGRKALVQKIIDAAATAPTPAPTVPLPPETPGTTTPPVTPPMTPPMTPPTTTPTTTPVTTSPVTTPPVTTPVTTMEPPPAGNESYEVLMQKAEKALVSDRSKAAYDLLKRAVALRGDVARPWLKLGWASVDLGKHAEAQRAFRKALDIDGGLSEAQFGLAEALRFGGNKPEAVVAYKAYLQMDPAGKDAGIAKNALSQLE